MKLLITGFEPFNGAKVNPSQLLMSEVDKMNFEDKEIKTLVLPVTVSAAFGVLKDAIDEFNPDVVINVGQAHRRETVTIERIAINVNDYAIPDNDGITIKDQPINPNGPIAYFATLDVKSIIDKVKAKGLELKISDSAGTYVCNTVMYQAIDYSKGKYKSAFVHLPLIKEQLDRFPGLPYVEMSEITKVFKAIIEAI